MTIINVKLNNLTHEQTMRVYELASRKRMTVKDLVKEALIDKIDKEWRAPKPLQKPFISHRIPRKEGDMRPVDKNGFFC